MQWAGAKNSRVQWDGVKKHTGHSSLQNAQRVSSTNVWLSSSCSTGHFLWRSGLQGKDINLHVSLRMWSGPWEKDWLELRPKCAWDGTHLCASHPWFPSHEAWISLISFSEHLEFWKVVKITFSEKVWFIPQPHVKHCYFFLLGVIHKEPDKELISGHLQWSGGLLKPVDFKYIPKGISEFHKTSQNLFSSACGITTPQS